MAEMEYRELGRTGMKISFIGYGASPLGGVFDEADAGEGVKAVHYAIDHGVNYFDVAPMYGETLAETRLGKALKGKRDDIFLATKAGRYGMEKFDFSHDRVLHSIDESLERLQTDYVDVFQIHDIEFCDKRQLLDEAIPAAMKVKEAGKARFVGITGLPVRYLAAIAREVELDTVLSWAHYNLLEDEINDDMVPLSKEQGFGLMSSAPLLQRILSDSKIPDWHRSPKPMLDMQAPLLALAAEYGVDLGDVALRYAIDHPDLVTNIIGMSKMRSVERNMRVLDFTIPDGLLERIRELVAPVKNMMWYEGKPENDIPKG